MRTFFYSFAAICGMVALALFLFPIVTSLPNLRNGFGALVTFGMATSVVPIAVALALIPLCIAISFDRATRD